MTDEELDNLELEDDGYEPQTQRELNRNQKIALGVFSALGVLIIIFWAIELKNNISGPFNYDNLSSDTGAENTNQDGTCSGGNCEQSAADLKAKDTDKDGLSDWDELNVYKTSPYLEDSDSDGFNDKEEIDSNKDPNCPTGQDCNSSSQMQSNQASSTDSSLLDNLTGSTGSDDESDLQDILAGQATADSLRQILLESGITQEELDQVSDEELMASYQETLQTQSAE